MAAPETRPGGVDSDKQALEAKFQRLQNEMDAAHGLPSGNTGSNPLPGKSRATEPTGILSLSLQIFFGLIFVLILAVVTLRFLKRLQRNAGFKPKGMGQDFFQVLETCYLDSQHKVVALRMGPRMGIIGISPQSVSLLHEFTETPSELGFGTQGEGNAAAFSESFNKVLERFKKPKRVSDLLEEG